MCEDCGCGLPGKTPPGYSVHDHDHHHEHSHAHAHEHSHGPGVTHSHSHSHAGEDHHDHNHEPEPDAGFVGRRTVQVQKAILEKNDRQAERNRGFFHARGLLVLNVLSSPGSGKTTLLRETARRLAPKLKSGIIVGDLATDNDAQRLRESGAPVVQITTGTVCHLEAEMVGRAVGHLDLNGLGLLIIENVGNLVCPASYDLGEDLRVVLLSVTEGEDKPLKYPPMFQSAEVVIISKSDLSEACGYDRSVALANLQRVAPKARIFELSARTGRGLEEWLAFLLRTAEERKTANPLVPQ